MRSPIVVPEFGSAEVTFSLWLVSPGDSVYEGDRVAELLVGAATVDIVSPLDGRFQEALAQPGERLGLGQTLGFVVEG